MDLIGQGNLPLSEIENLQLQINNLQNEVNNLQNENIKLLKYKFFVENASEGIAVLQADIVQYANPKFYEILEYSKEEFDSIDNVKIIHPDDLKSLFELQELRHKGVEVKSEYDFRVITKSSKLKWLHSSVVKLDWFDKTSSLSFLSDITERKNLEENLKSFNSNLDAIIKDKTAKLEEEIVNRVNAEIQTDYFKRFFEQMFLKSNVGKLLFDVNGNCTSLNQKAKQVLGIDSEMLDGYNIFQDNYLESLGLQNSFFKLFKEGITLETEIEYNFDKSLLCNSLLTYIQGVIWLTIKGYPIINSLGEIENIIIEVDDITSNKFALEALRESEIRYRLIAQNLPKGLVFMFDNDLRINLAIGQGFDYLDFAPFDVMGKKPSEFNVSVKFKSLEEIFQQIISGQMVSREIVYNDNYFLINGLPIKSSNGFIFAGMIIATNITEEKVRQQELSSTNELLRNILSSLNESVIILDFETRIVEDCNLQTEVIFGYTKQELIGKQLHLLHQNKMMYDFFIQNGLRDIEDVGFFQTDYTMKSKNGELFPTEHFVKPIYDHNNKPVKYISVIKDITERKRNEQEISKLNSELEQRVIERTNQLEDTLEEIKAEIEERKRIELALIESNNTKDKFFSIIAHDLSNPLHSLMMSAEILDSYSEKLEAATLRKQHNQIYSSSKHLMNLLNNLLQWARSQRGRLDFNPTFLNFNTILTANISLSKDAITSKNITIINEVSNNVLIYADNNMLSTVIRNLLSNAIKFSKNNGVIIFKSKLTGAFIELFISDNGVGISDEDKHKLFRIDTIFTKTGTDNEQGTGLGLILCKEFIERHNGRISVESQFNIGTTFIISLPQPESSFKLKFE